MQTVLTSIKDVAAFCVSLCNGPLFVGIFGAPEVKMSQFASL
jgi:hypothetical protein